MSDSTQPGPRPYHHGDLRQTLLDTCCLHIAREGLEGLSLRALAREAGVSPTAPYRHFETRQALLAAVAAEGFAQLTRRLAGVRLQWEEQPVRALYLAGLAYIRYAAEQPVRYQLMFGDLIGDFTDHQDLIQAACDCYAQMYSILDAGVADRVWVSSDSEALAGQVWALLHGVAGLVIAYRRKAEQGVLDRLHELPPVRAQQRLAANPEQALLQGLGGIVLDRAALEALR